MAEVKCLVEAALFMAGRSVGVRELGQVVGVSSDEVRIALDELSGEYASRGAGIALEWTGKTAFMHVREDIEDDIMSLAPATHMSRGMLKTLAVIANEGPIKKSDLVKQRGTRVYYYAQKLLEEELISARKCGRTKLLSVTPKFNKYFKIKEIPKVDASSEVEIEEVSAETETVVEESHNEVENHEHFEMK